MGKLKRKAKWIFIVPSFLGVSVFFFLPFISLVYDSVIDNISDKNFVGLYNYKQLLSNSTFCIASKNTILFSVISVPLAVSISLLLAVIMDREMPFKSVIRSFLLSPFMVPMASVVLIWRVVFDTKGIANTILCFLNLTPVKWFESKYSLIMIVVVFLWKNLGYNMIIFMSALNGIPTDVCEAALLDGTSRFACFWLIKLRYLASSIFFVGILSLINSFKIYREVYLLAGDHPYESLYMMQHFMNNTFRASNYQKLASAAVLMCIVLILIIGGLFLIEKKVSRDIEN